MEKAVQMILAAFACAASLAAAAPGEAFSEALVDAPPAQVWDAFTTRAGMESWMVAHAEVDVRVGGKLRTHYRKEGVIGDEGTIENSILSLDPPHMLSTRIARTPKGFPFPNAWQSVWSVIYFEPAGAGRTRVSIRMLGYTEDEESQKMREFFLRGNQYTLDQLVAKYRPAN
jgi:uncharacterized protein YndB with AHSA1/START domain